MNTRLNKRLKKDTVKTFVNATYVAIYIMLYFVMVMLAYDNNREYDYGIRGYFTLLAIYGFTLVTFLNMFGSFKLGNKKISDIAISSILAIFFADFIIYFVFGLIEGHLILVIPHILLFIVQAALSVYFARRGTSLIRFTFPPKKALLVYGTNVYKEVVAKLNKYQKYEFDIAKTISEKKLTNNLETLLNDYECVITVDVDHNTKKIITKACFEKDLHVYDVPSITDVIIKSSDVTNFIDTPLFRMNRLGPSLFERKIKRVIDLFGSILLLIVGLIPMIVSAIIIKAQDGGDIFFRQKRLTLDGKEFELIKFRSMIMNAEPEGKAIRAKVNDDRITKYGKFMRSTRIDELPQVFNILKGDLSFVGPRALRIEEYTQNEKEFPEFKYRLKVKAGLTGYAQIYGKYNTTFRDKLLLDIYYIENYSLILDIKLILMTVVTMFMKDSTEGFKND